MPVEDLVALRVPARCAEQEELVSFGNERALRASRRVADHEGVLALERLGGESRDERWRAVRTECEVVAECHPQAGHEAAGGAALAAGDIDHDRAGRPLEPIEDHTLRIGRPSEDPGEESVGTRCQAARARSVRIDDPETIVDQGAIGGGREAPHIRDLRSVRGDRGPDQVGAVAPDLTEPSVFEIDQRESVTLFTRALLANAVGKPARIPRELSTKFVGWKRIRPRGLVHSVVEARALDRLATGNGNRPELAELQRERPIAVQGRHLPGMQWTDR